MDEDENFIEDIGEMHDDVEIIEDEENELHFSVEGLGQFHDVEGQKLFVKTDDSADCIHDIQIALRKDNSGEGRRVDKLLGKWGTVEKQLVPLFLHYREDPRIWSGVLKLLVILTRPLTKNVQDKSLHLRYMQDYKEALTTQDVFITLMSILMDAMSVNEQAETQINEIETQIARIEAQPVQPEQTTTVGPSSIGETQEAVPDQKVLELKREEAEKKAKKERRRLKEQKLAEIRTLSEQSKVHEKNVELVLTLIRHLLEIPDPKQGDMAFSQSRGQLQIVLIKHLSDEGVLDLLVMFAEHAVLQPRLRHLNWLFFEIFYHICATIPPTELANYDHLFKRDLSKLLDVEKRLVFAQVPQYSRHSRFANAGVLKSVAPRAAAATAPIVEVNNQKAARNRFYREKRIVSNPDDPGAQQINLFQDPSFIDINTGDEMLPSSILGKDYRDFYADIRTFIDQWMDSVSTKLMKSVFSEIEQESKNLHEYDTVRVLNMIAWILDYQGKLVKNSKKDSHFSVPLDSIAWAFSQDSLNLVTRQLKQHSKEAKTIKHGGANLVVTLRAVLEQLRFARAMGPDSGHSFTVMDSFCYDEINRLLTWTVRNYKPTANLLEVLSLSLQCVDEFLRMIEMFEKKLGRKERSLPKSKKRNPKISQAEAEFQGIDMYDQGVSDSDVSVHTSGDDVEDENLAFLDSLREAKAAIMADVCHSDAINHIFHALNLFKDMSPATNAAVAAILLRITQEQASYIAYFFQLSSLVVLNNIVSDPILRTVEEERLKYDSVILIAKLIIRKFLKVSRINKLVFIEALFPRARGGRGGSLLSIEADLSAICTNYADEESRVLLERIHNGDTYESLKAERREQAKYTMPWSDEEDNQLIGLWAHVKEMDDRSIRDKINSVVVNLRPIEGRKKRRFKEVKNRLVAIGLLDEVDGDLSDYSDFSSNTDEANMPRSDISDSEGSRSASDSDDEGQQMDFKEYIKRVNAVKVSEELTNIFQSILALNTGLIQAERDNLGLMPV
jgi:hypothetical protein